MTVGRVVASYKLVAAAAGMAAAALAYGVLISPKVMRDGDWRHVAPAAELSRRLAGGGLWDWQASSVAETALDVQANASVVWNEAYGDVIEAARQRGALDDEAWRRYARHGPQPYVETRSAVRQGDRIRIDLWLGPSRQDDRASGLVINHRGAHHNDPATSPWPPDEPIFVFRPMLASYRLGDGPPVDVEPPHNPWHRNEATLPVDGRRLSSDAYPFYIEVPDDQPPGETTLALTFDLEVFQEGPRPSRRERGPITVLASWRETFDWPILVAAEGAEVVEIVEPTPLLRAAVESSIKLLENSADLFGPEYPGFVQQPYRQGRAELHLSIGRRPVPVGFAVKLRLPDGTLHDEGYRLSAEAEGRGVATFIGREAMERFERLGVRHVDVILEPTPEAVRHVPGIDRIYGGVVELRNVPIRYASSDRASNR